MTAYHWIGPIAVGLLAVLACAVLVAVTKKRPRPPRPRDWRTAVYNPREYRRPHH